MRRGRIDRRFLRCQSLSRIMSFSLRWKAGQTASWSSSGAVAYR